MQVWLLDYEKFIKLNDLKPVTNPIMFDAGNIPTSDGLFSTEIFGLSIGDRRNTFAYIDLGMHFMNPKAYITLKRVNRNFESVVYGTKKFNIVNGELVPDENGGTGMEWLYKNWDKLKFPKNESVIRSERVDLLSINKKDILFTTKFLVIPAFYRDVNLQNNSTNPRVPEINDIYAKIMRNVKMLQDANNMDFMLASITGKVQDLLVDVYNNIKDKIQGKSGYIRKFLLGKSVDYASRVVITAAPYNYESIEEQDVNFYYTGVPLSHICSEFTPFMVWWTKRWFKNNIENHADSFPVVDNKGGVQYIKLDRPEVYFNEEYIEKKLGQYVSNPYSRFDTIDLPVKPEELKKIGKKTVSFALTGYITDKLEDFTTMEKTGENRLHRYMTWTDLFYMAAVDVTADKHVWVTRYPMLDYLGTYTTRITIISTRETTPMIINGRLYPKYPKIDLSTKKEDMDAVFRDTINVPFMYLPGLGGDHDGDQITCKGVFTQEANEECEEWMTSKANLLSIEGKTIRKFGNEGIQTLYSMTKFH